MSLLSANPITAGISAIGGLIKGFFGIRQAQADVVSKSIDLISSYNISEAEKTQAIAQVITAEAQSGYWLAACWRPLLMTFFGILIGARWFGYVPPNMSEAEMMQMYNLLQLGIGGYIGSRGLEKIVSNLSVGKALNSYINKKLS